MSNTDFTKLDDPVLISERARLRAKLENLYPSSDVWRTAKILFDAATWEIDHRARQAWTSEGGTAVPGLLPEGNEFGQAGADY
jgi:hypothetical protein